MSSIKLWSLTRMEVPVCVFLWFIICLQVKCEDEVVKSKNPLPYFRRQVEEVTDEPTSRSTLSDDSHLVSFLIKNVKEIFDDVELQELSSSVASNAVTAISEIKHKIESSTENNNRSNMTTVNFDSTITVTRTEPPTLDTSSSTSLVINLNEMVQYRNFTVVPACADKEVINLKEFESLSTTTTNELSEKEELMHLSKNLIFYETDRRARDNYSSFRPNTSNTANVKGTASNIRSCIFCNNVGLEDCNDPSNRLIPSTVCEREDDVCYTQHTPFGVIDRGCFNVNHNLTTYVCACNLCNYISISEMPHIFPTKLDWIDNVVELSRMRQFGKSVFKDMSCLKCESNASANGEMLDTANCLEGNIGSLPTQECEENEVCAVKAIKNNGYLWRGCVKTPLFNYWWALCDSDLCNYDPIITIYDVQ